MQLAEALRRPLAGRIAAFVDRVGSDPEELLRWSVPALPVLIALLLVVHPLAPLFLILPILLIGLFLWPAHRLLMLLLVYLPLHVYLSQAEVLGESGAGMGPFSVMGMAKDLLIILLFASWLFGVLVRRKYRFVETPINGLVLAFVGLAFLHIVNFSSIKLGIWGFRNYVEYLVLFFVAASCVNQTRQIRNVLFVVILSAIPALLFGIYQLATGELFMFLAAGVLNQNERVAGVFGSQMATNAYGMYLMILILISLAVLRTFQSRAGRILLFLTTLLATFSLVLTFSRRAWLATLLGGFVLSMFSRRRKTVLLLIAIVVVGASFLAPSVFLERFLSSFDAAAKANVGRLHEWAWIMEQTFASPFSALWGVGLGVIGPVSMSFETTGGVNTHNSYLCVLGELGLPGLLILLVLIGVLLRDGFRSVSTAPDPDTAAVRAALVTGIAAILFTGLFGVSLQTVPMNIYFWIFAGFLYASLKHTSLKEKQ